METVKDPIIYEEGKIEQKSRFIELLAKGNSYRKIAKKLNVSTGTLILCDKELSKEIKN